MPLVIVHNSTNNIADWTQVQLDAQIAAGFYPPGTVLADITKPSNWNANHTISGSIAWGEITGTLSNQTDLQTALNARATASFTTFAVSGQSDVVADSTADTLTLIAGTNITITTNAGSDSITINSSASAGASFDAITSGTNTTAAMVVGSGGTLGVSGSGTITATSVVAVDAGGDTTTFPLLAGAATGSTGPLTDAGLTYNATTNALTTTTFIGALTGNASTATALQNARTIGGVSFDGTANIVPQTIQVIDASADTTTFVMLAGSATGNLQPLTDAGLAYNASTNALTVGGRVTASTTSTATSLVSLSDLGQAVDANLTTNPSGASTNVTFAGRFSNTYSSASNLTGVGHFGGVFSITDVSSAATIATVYNMEARIQATAGAQTTAIGHTVAVQTASEGAAGTIGILIGYYFPDLTDHAYVSAKFCMVNADANAILQTAGVIRTPTLSTTSGDLTIIPSSGVTNFNGKMLLAENASIELDRAGSADGKFSGITIRAVSGYTQAFGDLVYLDPTDSRWEKTDANSAAGADGDARGLLGMVVVTGTDGNDCTILLQGNIRADSAFPSFTINNPVYVSETAGAVTQTQPTTTDVVIRVIGAALTADEFYFCPSYDYITHT